MRSLAIVVPKAKGEEVRKKLLESENLRKDLIVRRDEEHLYFPVLKGVDLGFEMRDMDFEEGGVAVRSYLDLVKVPHQLRSLLPTSFDIVGEIAVIKIPEELKEYSSAIGEAILGANKSVRTVVSDEGVVGDFRIRNIRVIAGKEDTRTTHREFGLMFAVDLKRAYFSPRLATERQRIVQKVKPGELIIDMFCGVGPFSVAISKNVPGTRIFGMDSNPYAIKNFMENIRMNKVENVVPMEGDVMDLMKSMEPADRIIMDLPQKAIEYFVLALSAIKNGGTIHYYEILTEVEARERESMLNAIGLEHGRRIMIEERRIVRGYSPSQNHYAFDIKVSWS